MIPINYIKDGNSSSDSLVPFYLKIGTLALDTLACLKSLYMSFNWGFYDERTEQECCNVGVGYDVKPIDAGTWWTVSEDCSEHFRWHLGVIVRTNSPASMRLRVQHPLIV